LQDPRIAGPLSWPVSFATNSHAEPFETPIITILIKNNPDNFLHLDHLPDDPERTASTKQYQHIRMLFAEGADIA